MYKNPAPVYSGICPGSALQHSGIIYTLCCSVTKIMDKNIILPHPHTAILFELIKQLGNSYLGIVIWGEPGVGKEAVARSLYYSSPKHKEPFIRIDCAALWPESDQPIHKRKAAEDDPGVEAIWRLFQTAGGGMYYFNQIQNLPINTQKMLSGFLSDLRRKTTTRNGKSTYCAPWVVASSTTCLETAAKMLAFDSELFSLLETINIHIPPLRCRPEKIPLIVDLYIEQYIGQRPDLKHNKPGPAILEKMVECKWPGNLRQLQEAIKTGLTRGWDVMLQQMDTYRPEKINAATVDLPLEKLSVLPDLSIKRGRLLEELMSTADLENMGLMDLVVIEEAIDQASSKNDPPRPKKPSPSEK